MFRVLHTLLGSLLVLVTSAALAQQPASSTRAYPANTTNITPDLYVRHGTRKPTDPPLLAHCRQMNVMVDGRMQSRRQCVTPADNF